jgi:5-hydroxyisourate hydrolase
MAGKLTTHVLDTELGQPAVGMKVELLRRQPDPAKVASLELDASGRATLLDELKTGVYELVFFVGDYHRKGGAPFAEPPFLDEVPVRFGISDASAHHHVPLVMARHSYTTYRGS